MKGTLTGGFLGFSILFSCAVFDTRGGGGDPQGAGAGGTDLRETGEAPGGGADISENGEASGLDQETSGSRTGTDISENREAPGGRADISENGEAPGRPGGPGAGLTDIQAALVEAAHWAVGRDDLSNNGRRFRMDCSGVVSALYWRAGLDLQSAYPRYTGSGTVRIHAWMADEALLYRPDEPAPGDLIFWDNSYDGNGSGSADDELTHIGMAVSVDDDGVVTYVHQDYISGVVFARMYPPEPSDPSRNSGMRMRSLGPTPEGGITSGDLYREAGSAWRIAQR